MTARAGRHLDAAEVLRGYRQLRSDRDRVLFGVQLLAGARIGEAVQLRIGDAFAVDGSVRQFLDIRPAIAKRKIGGLIPIGPDLSELLQHYGPRLELQDLEAPLVPSRKGGGFLHRSAGWRVIAGAFRRARLEGASPHSLRRAFASILLQRGVRPDVLQTLMRHQSLRTTDHYIHEIKPFELQAAVESLAFPLFSVALNTD